MKILTIAEKTDEKFLRKKTAAFDFSAYAKEEIRELVRTMRTAMRDARGVGLAANQIGLNSAVFVASVEGKFYALFNPEMIQTSDETELLEEGCLSIPRRYGLTPRAARVTLSAQNAQGRAVKIKAWGLLARVFQHEVDHLNGILFTDKATEVHDAQPDDDPTSRA